MSGKLTRKMIEEDVRSFLDNFKSSLKRRQQSGDSEVSASAEDGSESGGDTPTKRNLDQGEVEFIVQALRGDAKLYADNGYSAKGLVDLGRLPKLLGITYSEPLALAMYKSAAQAGLTEAGKYKAFASFRDRFNSDKTFAKQVVAVSQPVFDAIKSTTFQALVDYGQGFGPKNKDGNPIRNEGKVIIPLSTLKTIVKEQLEKSLRKQRS